MINIEVTHRQRNPDKFRLFKDYIYYIESPPAIKSSSKFEKFKWECAVLKTMLFQRRNLYMRAF